MQTLGVSVKQLRRKLLELGARILHVQGSKPRDMALVVRVSRKCAVSYLFSPVASRRCILVRRVDLTSHVRRCNDRIV